MNSELARAKWLLFSIALFLVTGCVSWGEFTSLVFGRDIQADVVNSYEVTRKGRFGSNQGQKQVVDYSFTEPDGTRRLGTDTVSTDWTIPAGGKVTVRYTAGVNGNSRLGGHVNWIALSLFGLSSISMGVVGFMLWRTAREATRESRPRR
jgi:hypothetical protein